MNRLVKSLTLIVFSCSLILLWSCTGNIPLAAQKGTADITMKRSSNVTDNLQYVFSQAPNGKNAIYAERTYADDDANAVCYIISALSSYDYPFEALEIKLVPTYKNKAGVTVKTHATVRITEYRIDWDETTEYNKETGQYELGYYAPKSYVYNLDSSNGFNENCYSIPISSNGHFWFSFSAGNLSPVETVEEYAPENERFPLISVNAVCPVMWRD